MLTNLLSLNKKFGLEIGTPSSKIINAIKLNLEWVNHCKRDNGWAWTNDSSAHPLAIPGVYRTFEEILNNPQLKEFHKEIESECNSIAVNILESFTTDVAGSYQNEWNTKVENSKPYDIETALDVVRLMLGVCLHSSSRQIKSIASMLFNWCAKSDFRNLDYTYHLTVKSDNIPDCSLVPMAFRTLLVMAGMLKPKHIGKLDEDLDKSHEVIINRVYSQLMKSQINHDRYSGLWGVPNGGTHYELYYTERTIEALTEFLLHYGNDLDVNVANVKEKKETVDKPKINEQEKKAIKKKKVLNISVPILSVLDEVSSDIIKNNESLLQNYSLVLVLHILSDLIPLAEKFVNLGCEAKNIYLIAKTYKYPEKDKIIKYLKENDYNVFEPLKPDHNSYLEVCKTIMDICIEKIKSENKKILIVEDGGYFVPLIHDDIYKDYLNYITGAVEQTTKGHRRDKNIEDCKIPVISVANSKLKSTLEGDEVAHTLQENIIKLVKDYVKKPTHELNVLVLGYGTIGKNLASFLADKNLKTYIYDNDEFERLKAEFISKITVLENLDDLSFFDIIIGTSGNTSINDAKHFWNLKQNVFLVSGSSERVEFNLEKLDSISQVVKKDNFITKYILTKDEKFK